jgi:hypothetical protein
VFDVVFFSPFRKIHKKYVFRLGWVVAGSITNYKWKVSLKK